MDKTALLQYTGGTTEVFPRAIILTHRNLVANAYPMPSVVFRSWTMAKEVFMLAIPIFHSYGMTAGMNFALLTDGRLDGFDSPSLRWCRF